MNTLASEIFNLTNIITFVVGMFFGVLFFVSIIMIALAVDKKKKKNVGSTMEALSSDKIGELIEGKKASFNHEVEDNDQDMFACTKDLIMELVHEVSTYYYPQSKHPELELTVDEALLLIKHIYENVYAFSEKKLVKYAKNHIKLSQLFTYLNSGKKVMDSDIVSNSDESIKVYKSIANTLNPVYWFKKVVIGGATNIAFKKICRHAITVVGVESNSVYSKSLFIKEDTQELKKIEEIYSDEEDE